MPAKLHPKVLTPTTLLTASSAAEELLRWVCCLVLGAGHAGKVARLVGGLDGVGGVQLRVLHPVCVRTENGNGQVRGGGVREDGKRERPGEGGRGE